MTEALAQTPFTEHLWKLFDAIVQLDFDIVSLAALMLVAVIVVDAVIIFVEGQKKEAGIVETSTTVSIDGGTTLPIRHYVSEIQGLAGRPDALIKENGYIIPVERKPLSKKVRDRHVAQLLVYMRLVEEFEGKKPPHGYLVLGPSCRQVKVQNSEEKQAWLTNMLSEMNQVLAGKPALATPQPPKCRRCDVRDYCEFKKL